MCCVRCSGYCLKHARELSEARGTHAPRQGKPKSKKSPEEGKIRQPASLRAAAPPPKTWQRVFFVLPWPCLGVWECGFLVLDCRVWGVVIVFLPAWTHFRMPPTHAHSLPSPTPHQHRQQLQEYQEEEQHQLWQRKPRRWGWTRTGQRLEVRGGGGVCGMGGERTKLAARSAMCVCPPLQSYPSRLWVMHACNGRLLVGIPSNALSPLPPSPPLFPPLLPPSSPRPHHLLLLPRIPPSLRLTTLLSLNPLFPFCPCCLHARFYLNLLRSLTQARLPSFLPLGGIRSPPTLPPSLPLNPPPTSYSFPLLLLPTQIKSHRRSSGERGRGEQQQRHGAGGRGR